MLAQLLPQCVVTVETRIDRDDVVLFPLEEDALGRAVEKRRREFTSVRACAREALAKIGVAAVPIVNGPRGEPLWPAGVVGSITHCAGYRACALAEAADMLTLGIDAEPDEPLPNGVLPEIASPAEIDRLRELAVVAPAVHWDRLLFSAKECIYKAAYPIAQRWLGFDDATVSIDSGNGTFLATMLVPDAQLGDPRLARLSGRWLAQDGLLLTAIAVSATR